MEEQVKERLIRAGARLMTEKGFAGASVREICKEAETSSNMIHHYFGDKAGLRQAILSRYEEGVFATPMRLFETELRSRDDFVARMQLLFETTLEACIANREPMMLALREQASLRVMIDYQEAFVRFLDQAKAQGYLREAVEPSMISGAILDRITNIVEYAPWVEAHFGVKPLTDKAYQKRWIAANMDLFLNGFLANRLDDI